MSTESANTAVVIFSSILFSIITLSILSGIFSNQNQLGASSMQIFAQFKLLCILLAIGIFVSSIVSLSQNGNNGNMIAIVILSIIMMILIYIKKSVNNQNSLSLMQMLRWIVSLVILILSTI